MNRQYCSVRPIEPEPWPGADARSTKNGPKLEVARWVASGPGIERRSLGRLAIDPRLAAAPPPAGPGPVPPTSGDVFWPEDFDDPEIYLVYGDEAEVASRINIVIVPDGYRSLGPDGSVWGEAGVEEFDPPRRLVHGWRSMYDPDLVSEEESRVTWEIEPQDGGYSLLTVVHDRLEGAPMTAERVSGRGWMMVLSGLKTFLETGKPLAG